MTTMTDMMNVGANAAEAEEDNRVEICVNKLPYHKLVDKVAESFGQWYKNPTGKPIVINNGKIDKLTAEHAMYLASKQLVLYSNKRAKDSDDFYKEYEDPVPKIIIENALYWCKAPTLRGVTSIPFFNARWQLISTEGYDAESERYFQPEGLQIIDMTLEEAKEALKELTQDMLFLDDGARSNYANYIAYLLTPLIQPALSDKRVPMHLFRKNQRGTGATTAIEVLGLIYYGHAVNI
jgi:hypothetical protein